MSLFRSMAFLVVLYNNQTHSELVSVLCVTCASAVQKRLNLTRN